MNTKNNDTALRALAAKVKAATPPPTKRRKKATPLSSTSEHLIQQPVVTERDMPECEESIN